MTKHTKVAIVCSNMKNPFRHFLCLVTVSVLTAPAHAAAAGADIECIKSASFFAPIEAGADRNYPPDREVKVSHLALDLTPDFKQRTFEGKETFQFKPNGKPVRELSLDAVDLTILSVTSTGEIQGWQSTTDKLIITFVTPVPMDKETGVTIAYHAQASKGMTLARRIWATRRATRNWIPMVNPFKRAFGIHALIRQTRNSPPKSPVACRRE